jgi:NTE family protein
VTASALRFPPDHDRIVLVLQGGGALGAYQAGVYAELFKTPWQPNWLVGVSIGAVNAALIAGNPPERRLQRLREFWDTVSSGVTAPAPEGQPWREWFNQGSAAWAATAGVPGFYEPRVPPPYLQPPGTPAAISFYDPSALAATLRRLVDFERLNGGEVRLSLGAVNVHTGNSQYFDSLDTRIEVDHVLASGALPPAFPPVVIGGEPYWDGGIVSNTPLQYAMDLRDPTERLLVFQVDLFSARGPVPGTMNEVLQRYKDILYSSRTRYATDRTRALHNQRQGICDLVKALPAELRDDPRIQAVTALACAAPIDIVHLIYRHKRYELDSKDYEFSRASVREHWAAGERDLAGTLAHPDTLKRSGMDDGVTVYDWDSSAR